MRELLFILLGWLLGLLGPRIVEYVLSQYRKREVKACLLLELEDIRLRLALNAFSVAHKLGKVDRPLVKWLSPLVAAYKGFHADPKMVAVLEKLATLPDDQIHRRVEL